MSYTSHGNEKHEKQGAAPAERVHTAPASELDNTNETYIIT